MEKYKTFIGLTQQFRHCGNPFRIDTYKGCTFGCKYCFANMRGGNISKSFMTANPSDISKIFDKALLSDKESKNITIELLRNRVPLHLGGMSDPFQPFEFTEEGGSTYELLKISRQYNYPIMISTKQCMLPDKYFDVLDPNIHAIQVSIFSDNIETIRKFETNTPSPEERVEFIKKLHNLGFWVGVRIQPLININESISLVKKLNGYVNFATVEHLKIGNDNREKALELFELVGNNIEDYKCTGRNYELKYDIKKNNIDRIKSVAEFPIGCGDNDLHEYSDTNNCCGIDTINENFDNWLKYNSMNIRKTGDNNYWTPKCNCSNCFNSECQKKGFSFSDYVDDYMEKGLVDKRCNFKINK